MVGMVASMLTMFFVKTQTTIAWTWYVLIGTVATMSAGYLASLILREKSSAAAHT